MFLEKTTEYNSDENSNLQSKTTTLRFASKLVIKDKEMQNIFLYKICFIISLFPAFSAPAPLCFGSQQGTQ